MAIIFENQFLEKEEQELKDKGYKYLGWQVYSGNCEEIKKCHDLGHYKILEYNKIYRQNHKIEKRQYNKQYLSIPRNKLRYAISIAVNKKLRKRLLTKNGKGTFSFVPYTIDDLMKHLEFKFKPGMTWSNYGKWHIDHKKADCWFNYKSVEDEEFQKCWALDNLQPLWAEENLKKNKH
jgi:hypothetical protein